MRKIVQDWVTILEGRINRDRTEPSFDDLLSHIRYKTNLFIEHVYRNLTEERQSIMNEALNFAHELFQLKKLARKVINAYRKNDAEKLERAINELEKFLKEVNTSAKSTSRNSGQCHST
jgi:polyhydroxyalkanoate synthesis regulator phasin